MRLEGEQLGHYRLIRFLQGGGMGEVYLAEDLNLPRQVAIKVMKTETALYPDAQASKDAARLFQREMQAISMLDHPHILTLHDAGKQLINSENVSYMVMPYCPEGSLVDWISRHRRTQPLSPNEVARLLQQAADALQYAHDQKPQVLHLDIKPANFLVRRQTEPSQLPNLLLADFGVAKIAATSKLSATPRGTFEYMAPEQIEGTSVAASDQYALGIMIYELLTGRTPYQGAMPHAMPYMRNKVDPEPPSTVNSAIPQALDKVVLQALAKLPQDRFASVKDFASAFATVLKPSTNQPDKPTQKGQLSPQAYQLATTYQLGTPLEEFRVVYRKSYIFLGILLLIEVAAALGAALAVPVALGAALAVPVAIVSAVVVVVVVVVASTLAVVAGVVETAALVLAAGLSALLAVVLAVLAGLLAVWFIWYPKFHRSWRVYLCSDGFIYAHGKKIDVFPWHQIRLAEKHQSMYTVIRQDSKKVVLSPYFQSIGYLGDYIIREYERIKRHS